MTAIIEVVGIDLPFPLNWIAVIALATLLFLFIAFIEIVIVGSIILVRIWRQRRDARRRNQAIKLDMNTRFGRNGPKGPQR